MEIKNARSIQRAYIYILPVEERSKYFRNLIDSKELLGSSENRSKILDELRHRSL